MPWLSDPAGFPDDSRITPPAILPSTFGTVSAPRTVHFEAQSPGLHEPLSTLHQHPHEHQRMTRGRRGSLTLRRRALPSPPPCRFIPAHPETNPRQGARPATSAMRERLACPRSPAAWTSAVGQARQPSRQVPYTHSSAACSGETPIRLLRARTLPRKPGHRWFRAAGIRPRSGHDGGQLRQTGVADYPGDSPQSDGGGFAHTATDPDQRPPRPQQHPESIQRPTAARSSSWSHVHQTCTRHCGASKLDSHWKSRDLQSLVSSLRGSEHIP